MVKFDSIYYYNYVTAYDYDKVGNKTNIITGNGTQNTAYKYDNLNRILSITDALEKTETYTYNTDGNLSSKKDRNGNTITYKYNTMQRLTEEKCGNDIRSISYNTQGDKSQEKNNRRCK